MQSLVINSNEFPQRFDNGLVPETFKYRFLVEGDSWMDRSSAFQPSLLAKLAPAMDATNDDCLFINLSRFGDTIRRINECLNTDFRQWLRHGFNWKFDAILLSAGGNDFIDAARDPGPGQGILRDLRGQPLPARGRDCIRRDAVADLITQWLDPSFSNIYNEIEASKHAGTPIFLNSYDTPTARNAPALKDGRTWLFEAYNTNGIPSTLWPDLTDSLFNDIQTTMVGWAQGRANVHIVLTDGTLTPAAPGSPGSGQDWLNEIHPNRTGWGKLAPVWHRAIKNVMP